MRLSRLRRSSTLRFKKVGGRLRPDKRMHRTAQHRRLALQVAGDAQRRLSGATMPRFSGLGSLDRPEDLLAKPIITYEGVRNAPGDPYPALDFFVTTKHMIDWVLPGQASR